ncbi:MAG: PEP-CTERM sorting domain-containing protein [Phycisphaerae bacterium]|nr:PEP-CTERM sorting domain-containing protein [Phycisphaerae bacterium]
MQTLRGCALAAALACLFTSPSWAEGPMLFDLGMQYGHDDTGSSIEVWNYSLADPAQTEPIAVNGAGGSYLSKNWMDQFWMVDALGSDTGYRDVTITKTNASEAWVTDPLEIEFLFLDMPTYVVVGPIDLTITTRNAGEQPSIVNLQLPSDAWSSPTSDPLVLGPTVLHTAYPSQFDADEQVTQVRIEMTVIPEPAAIGLLALGVGILARRRRMQ